MPERTLQEAIAARLLSAEFIEAVKILSGREGVIHAGKHLGTAELRDDAAMAQAGEAYRKTLVESIRKALRDGQVTLGDSLTEQVAAHPLHKAASVVMDPQAVEAVRIIAGDRGVELLTQQVIGGLWGDEEGKQAQIQAESDLEWEVGRSLSRAVAAKGQPGETHLLLEEPLRSRSAKVLPMHREEVQQPEYVPPVQPAAVPEPEFVQRVLPEPDPEPSYAMAAYDVPSEVTYESMPAPPPPLHEEIRPAVRAAAYTPYTPPPYTLPTSGGLEAAAPAKASVQAAPESDTAALESVWPVRPGNASQF